METFFDIVKILSQVMDLVFIVIVIVLIKRYKALRGELDTVMDYLIQEGKMNIVKNELEIAKNNVEITKQHKTQIIQFLLDFIKPLIGNTYLISVLDTASDDLVTFKIYPKGANEDSGFVISFVESGFNYTEAKSEIMRGLVKCGYMKIPIVNE